MTYNAADLVASVHGYERETHAALPTREKRRVGGAWRDAHEADAHAEQGSVQHYPGTLMERGR